VIIEKEVDEGKRFENQDQYDSEIEKLGEFMAKPENFNAYKLSWLIFNKLIQQENEFTDTFPL
jgi:hypothetical protein